MTALQMFGALITHPRRAFLELEKNPRFALPMILLLVANAALIIWFYSTVDIDAFINHMLSERGLGAAQRAQVGAFMSRNVLMGSAVVSSVVVLVIMQLIEAFYFFFIYEFLDVRRSFRQWFAFMWWCSMPQLITIVAAIVMLVVRHGSNALSDLSPLSANALFYHFDPEDHGYTLLNSLTLVQPLTILLMVIGTHTWSQRSWVLNTVVVVLPGLLLYSFWAWWVFFK